MGEYADDSIEREWNEMFDEIEDGDIDDGSFIRIGETTKEHYSFVNEPINNQYRVIGNIYQNKELLGL